MKVEKFIKTNRQEIVDYISSCLYGDGDSSIFTEKKIRKWRREVYNNDEELRLWVLNDEGLYNWMKSFDE